MPKIIVQQGYRQISEFDIPEGETTIGRSPECDLTLARQGVSRMHVKIVRVGDTVTAEDPADEQGKVALLEQVAAYYGEEVAATLGDQISVKDREERTVEDKPLLRAVEILQEGGDWASLVAKYHRDISETQVAASEVAAQTDTSSSELTLQAE